MWNATIKAIELLGAFLVLIPLYHTLYLQKHHMPLEKQADISGPGDPSDHLQQLASELRTYTAVYTITISRAGFWCVIFGSVLLVVAGMFEVLERAGYTHLLWDGLMHTLARIKLPI